MKDDRALVVLSGGQDSTTVLGVAMKDKKYVEAVFFNYGQKHIAEMHAAQHIADRHDIFLTVIDLRSPFKNMRSSALITHTDTAKPHPILKDLPASFVPARNALFLTIAYGMAIEKEMGHVYTGVCQTDYSGYPDCRDDFVRMLNQTLNMGYASDIAIHTPLMHLTKAQTFLLAETVDMLDDVIRHSVTCYEGDIITRSAWGMGCGECPACKLRAKGWEEYSIMVA